MTNFRLARDSDDAALRAMLRDNGMPTWVEMSIEREPSFFAGSIGQEWAVIGEHADRPVAMYTGSVLPVYLNGSRELAGYLGGMRVVRSMRNRIRLIREGYASIERLAPTATSVPWWFSVIATDNVRARRLLEAGVPGLPQYWLLGKYVTLAMSTSRGRHRDLWHFCSESQMPDLIAFHNAQASQHDLAPVLDAGIIERIGATRFLVYAPQGEISGVAALWDQRSFKQIVAKRYSRAVRNLLPVYNAYARMFRRITLPNEGSQLDQTFIAYFALADDAMPQARLLLQDLLARCRTPVASLGVHADHPLLPVLSRFAPTRYPANVYGVSYAVKPQLHGRTIQPEVALL